MLREILQWYIENANLKKVLALAHDLKVNIRLVKKTSEEMSRKLLLVKLMQPNPQKEIFKISAKRFAEIIKMTDGKLVSFKENQSRIIEKFDIFEYLLCVAYCADSDTNQKPEEWKQYITDLQDLYRKETKADLCNNDASDLQLQSLKEEIFNLKKQINLAEEKTLSLEKKLQKKDSELNSILTENQHGRDKLIREQNIQKEQLIKITKKYQDAMKSFTEQNKSLLQEKKTTELISNSLSEKEKQIEEYKKEIQKLVVSIEESRKIIDAWKASYPNFDPLKNYLNVLIIGEKAMDEIIFVHGRPVKKYYIDINEFIDLIEQKELPKFDLVLVRPRKCNAKQWNLFQENVERIAKAWKQVFSAKQIIEKIEQSIKGGGDINE